MKRSTEYQRFIVTQTRLQKGINLIEASAGTGKTYAIAMLVVRFVVEKRMRIEHLLIVTFTKAATEELKDRIRTRLVDAKRVLNGNTVDHPALAEWLQQLDMKPELIQNSLELALLEIDQAGIFTIHGFCQRVLKEHALESGQLFDSELTGSIDTIRQQMCDDFWRKQVYPRSVLAVSALTARYKTPDELQHSIHTIDLNHPVEPPLRSLDMVLKQFESCYRAAKEPFIEIHQQVTRLLEKNNDKFTRKFSGHFDEASKSMRQWLFWESQLMPSLDDLTLFTFNGLKAGLNGQKFRKTQAESSDERKIAYLAELVLATEAVDALLHALDETTLMLRRALLEYLQQTLDGELQKLNVLSYDDLITRLAQALKGKKGIYLQTELRQRYKVALIDEFQDTDQTQWDIFSTVFASNKHYLYLIGDPKQAIYKFRGADIYTYFKAQQQATHRFTLKQNWRSHPALVEAINKLYKRHNNPFLFEPLNFIEVEAAFSTDQGELQPAKEESPAPMVLWHLKEPGNQHYWTSGKATKAIQVSITNEILSLLGQAKLIQSGSSQVLKPGDIAILVRSNKDAQSYQKMLQAVKVPSVINSKQSVFATDEASDLLTLLQAIAYSNEINYLKQALLGSWFNLNGQAFYQLTQNEHELDQWMDRFQVYHQLWQSKGLMSMLSNCLAQESIWIHLANKPLAERRLTNLNHLIELLQQAAVDEHLNIHKTLDWLQTAIEDKSEADGLQLRLESDEDAVKIITMHGCKGLEYPVVFCPGLWKQGSSRTNRDWVKCYEQGHVITDLGSDQFDRRLVMAEQESLAEDLRLLYVAITRAQYRCYMIWANVRTKQKPNMSAMAYLLFSNGNEDWKESLKAIDTQQHTQQLQMICKQSKHHCHYQQILSTTELAPDYQRTNQFYSLSALTSHRQLTSYWQMSSYSALASLSAHDSSELPLDKAQEPNELTREPVDNGIPEIPKGIHTGNAVHDLLENIDFTALASGDDISVQRDAVCRRYGLTLEQPERLDQLLQNTVTTPLSYDHSDFYLANLAPQACLKEMPFYYAMDRLNTRAINHVLRYCPTFQPLNDKTMQGFLTGFIDLVCEYQGRYYVMDYKTNWLPDYHFERMTEVMREHNYGLQYWIYTLVLDQYLHNRLPDYQYETHFGGVRYLFVRGMYAQQPMSGVFEDYPEPEKLHELRQVIG